MFSDSLCTEVRYLVLTPLDGKFTVLQSNSRTHTFYFFNSSYCVYFILSHNRLGYKPISLLTCPKHHICFPGDTHSTNANLTRNPLSSLKLDIVSRDDMGKQRLDFIDRQESSGTEDGSGRR